MIENGKKPIDYKTAEAFSNSWNNVFSFDPYLDDQIIEWLSPLKNHHFRNKDVLEMGCGSGAILKYIAKSGATLAIGIDLGDSVIAAIENLKNYTNAKVIKDDLMQCRKLKDKRFDIVYCIGVLHHLKEPLKGFHSVLSKTTHGGCFHCWVYAKEGNFIVRSFVEPLRKIVCRLPWFINKYLVALPLSVPFFFYSKFCKFIFSTHRLSIVAKYLPMLNYMLWISKRNFAFHHHVAFDQLVTPQTTFISKKEIESWLDDDRIVKASTYLIHRNGNGWKFGGTCR